MSLRAVALPTIVVGVVLMMVVPVPAVILDLLLATNITLAIVVVLGTIFLRDSLEFSSFPSLILIATLARLALNVSSTRLILLNGYAGKVIETFGGFVVGGSVIVGLVVFLILIVIQFVVVTNGAGRVAEVAARFTLDAMPGRQMAIDSDLAAGVLDQNEAREARRRIARESDFYGAMDGASKFVKGDAIAGIVIVIINLIGGLAIGMGTHKMSLGEATSTYSLLTVGDGLVTQIPALLLSIATGLLVTRVQSEHDLARDIGAQLLARGQALRVAAFVVAGMALLPGLPKIPFIVLGVGLWAASQAADRRERAAAEAEPTTLTMQTSPDDPESIIGQVRVEALELHLAADVLDLIDESVGGELLPRVRALRRQIAAELGWVMPLVRTRDDVTLPHGTYSIQLYGVEVGRGTAPRGKVLALPLEDGRSLASLGTETVEPVFGLTAYWIPEEARREAAAMGATVVDRPSAIVTHLAEVARRHASELLTRQDVQQLVEALRHDQPLLAGEVGAEHLPLSTLHAVLRGLLDEQVPVRNMSRIVEAVSARARETRSVEHLLAAARVPLGAEICAQVAPDGTLGVVTLDPMFETALHESLRDLEGELRLVPDPARAQMLRNDVDQAASRPSAEPLAVVCGPLMRRPLRRLLAGLGLDVSVIAYSELPSQLTVLTKGVIGAVGADVNS